jgi:hypothetical protein
MQHIASLLNDISKTQTNNDDNNKIIDFVKLFIIFSPFVPRPADQKVYLNEYNYQLSLMEKLLSLYCQLAIHNNVDEIYLLNYKICLDFLLEKITNEDYKRNLKNLLSFVPSNATKNYELYTNNRNYKCIIFGKDVMLSYIKNIFQYLNSYHQTDAISQQINHLIELLHINREILDINRQPVNDLICCLYLILAGQYKNNRPESLINFENFLGNYKANDDIPQFHDYHNNNQVDISNSFISINHYSGNISYNKTQEFLLLQAYNINCNLPDELKNIELKEPNLQYQRSFLPISTEPLFELLKLPQEQQQRMSPIEQLLRELIWIRKYDELQKEEKNSQEREQVRRARLWEEGPIEKYLRLKEEDRQRQQQQQQRQQQQQQRQQQQQQIPINQPLNLPISQINLQVPQVQHQISQNNNPIPQFENQIINQSIPSVNHQIRQLVQQNRSNSPINHNNSKKNATKIDTIFIFKIICLLVILGLIVHVALM